jgi:DNA transformation protein and related proteins
MRVTEGFREYVLEQLAGVDQVQARAMFGGVGLYADDLFFGLLAADTLYFKVDDSNRPAYEAAGMTVFKPYADRAMTMPYYQVPASVIEDSAQLGAWANAAIRAAMSARKVARRSKRR